MVRTRLLGVQSAAAMLQSPLITKQTESGEPGEFDAVTDAELAANAHDRRTWQHSRQG